MLLILFTNGICLYKQIVQYRKHVCLISHLSFSFSPSFYFSFPSIFYYFLKETCFFQILDLYDVHTFKISTSHLCLDVFIWIWFIHAFIYTTISLRPSDFRSIVFTLTKHDFVFKSTKLFIQQVLFRYL